MPHPSFDLVVYGASSFVGRLLTRYLLSTFGVDGDLRWAIAGRSHDRLKDVCDELGPEARALPLITANAHDESALTKLCEQTRLVVSTVGPYALLGEPLVSACAHSGTDYCDLSGEVPWIRRMIATYEGVAQASGARLVPCCGFDSIPSDLGVYFLQQHMVEHFGQPAVRIKMRVKGAKGGISGGTAASLLNVAKEARASEAIRRELADPYSLCPTGHRYSVRQPSVDRAVYDADLSRWVAPFLMAQVNTRVVLRSNALLGDAYGSTFQYDEAVVTKNRWRAQVMARSQNGLLALASVPPTRRLLEALVLPKPGKGPSVAAQQNGYFALHFSGRTAKGQAMSVKVTGDRDPGYGSTAKMLGQAAVCLATDIDHDTLPGGFWTPASAMGDRLLPRLTQFSGLTFATLSGD